MKLTKILPLFLLFLNSASLVFGISCHVCNFIDTDDPKLIKELDSTPDCKENPPIDYLQDFPSSVPAGDDAAKSTSKFQQKFPNVFPIRLPEVTRGQQQLEAELEQERQLRAVRVICYTLQGKYNGSTLIARGVTVLDGLMEDYTMFNDEWAVPEIDDSRLGLCDNEDGCNGGDLFSLSDLECHVCNFVNGPDDLKKIFKSEDSCKINPSDSQLVTVPKYPTFTGALMTWPEVEVDFKDDQKLAGQMINRGHIQAQSKNRGQVKQTEGWGPSCFSWDLKVLVESAPGEKVAADLVMRGALWENPNSKARCQNFTKEEQESLGFLLGVEVTFGEGCLWNNNGALGTYFSHYLAFALISLAFLRSLCFY